MRTITEIIIHCSATVEGKDYSAAEIDRWHKQRGWKGIGYHYVIGRDGSVEQGRPIEQVGAHCAGRNAHSIGICYIGGLDKNGKPKDTRTQAQRQSLLELVDRLLQQFPDATVHTHNEFANKACPGFKVFSHYGQ